jgi:translation elongation factor EF-1alpha
MAKEKEHINVAIIGHVDHGKSTMIGRLLYEAGQIPPHIIEQYRKEAEQKGKATFEPRHSIRKASPGDLNLALLLTMPAMCGAFSPDK